MKGDAHRVLVLEDDPDTAEQLVDCLQTSGYTIDLASDGDKGLALGRSTDYVVMTVDRMLPRVDGIEVIQRLTKDIREASDQLKRLIGGIKPPGA